MTVLILVLLLVLFFINVPIAFALGLAALIVSFLTDIPLIRLPQTMFASLNSFPLMAAPFFILAGKLMEHGGISQKIVDFANALVGHLRGGLAYVAIVASMFFAAISGSSIATTVAIGAIMIPAMVKMGYDRNFSSALHAASGTIGGFIPPSVPMVLYGVAGGVSVGSLFLAGFLPGVLVGLSFMVVAYFHSRKHNYPTLERKSWREVWLALKNAFWALMLPVIILGGIYSGIFTPTEASVVAVVYGFVIGAFVYKLIDWKVTKKILHSTVVTTATLGIIISAASYFGMWLTLERVPHTIAEMFQEANLSPLVGILLIILFLLILGTFMDATAGLVICTPILLPVAESLGFDPVHFGIIMIVTLGIGLLTPPLGVGLFVAAKIGNTQFEKIVRPAVAFIIAMIIDVILITLFPQISVGVANLFGK